LSQLRVLAGDYPELELTVPEIADSAWVDVLEEDRPGRALEEQLAHLRTTPAGEAGPTDLTARVDAVRAAIREGMGALQAQRQEIARLARELPEVGDLEDLARAHQVAESLHDSWRSQRDERLSQLGLESLEQASEREARAQRLRAQVVDQDLDPDLRQQVARPEELEELPLAQLQQLLRALPDQVEVAELEWDRAHKAWSSHREALARENPDKLLAACVERLRSLAAERLAPLSEPMTSEAATAAAEPVRAEVEAGALELERRRTELRAPEVSEEQAATGAGRAEQALQAARRTIERLTAELGQHVGKLESQADLFARLSRAEEGLARAGADLRAVEARAQAFRLLRTRLDVAKKELESDLVGPLRQQIGVRLRQITEGRYHELRLEQDFKAETLLTSTRQEAPLGDLSFGTREQVIFLSRLCLAELLSKNERQVLVYDDNLVHTDAARLEIACQLLLQVAEKVQVVLLTCHPERYAPIVKRARVQELLKL
ncbi:MAG: hypothetical protein AB1758_04115, partial [Candidatus Eremiobacterota bacterium]